MKPVIRGSLARRVLGISFLLFALPLLVYFFIVFRYNYKTKLEDTVVRFENLGKSRALALSDLTKYNFRTLELIEAMMDFERHLEHSSDDTINAIFYQLALKGHFDLISYYAIVDDGRFICSFSSDKNKIGTDYTNYHYVQNAVIYDQISFLAFSRRLQRRRFYVAKAIYSPKTHECIGVLTLGMSVNELLRKITLSEDSPFPIHFSILTEDYVIFESSDKDLSLRQLYTLSSSQLQRIEATRQFAGVPLRESNVRLNSMPGASNVTEMQREDSVFLATFLPISGTNLMLLAHANMERVFHTEHQVLFTILVIFIVVFAAGAIVTMWLTWRMSKPLASLCHVMGQVSTGDLQARYVVDKIGFEINSIGQIFNQTISSLIKNMEEAENERVQKETLARELNIGYDIQTSILPRKMPDFSGVEIAARYTPAKEVGGDFYDVFVKKGINEHDKLVVTVADAAGKGISACLYSLCVRSMLRSYYVEHDDITTIMERANDLFCLDTESTGMFVTVLTTIYDPRKKVLNYSSCGHNPGFVVHNDGSVEKISTPGMAMGVYEYDEVMGKSIQLQSEDLIILYTDGVTEAHDDKNELFGEERLLDFLERHREKDNVDTMADNLLAEIKHFSNTAPQHDDITIILMKIL